MTKRLFNGVIQNMDYTEELDYDKFNNLISGHIHYNGPRIFPDSDEPRKDDDVTLSYVYEDNISRMKNSTIKETFTRREGDDRETFSKNGGEEFVYGGMGELVEHSAHFMDEKVDCENSVTCSFNGSGDSSQYDFDGNVRSRDSRTVYKRNAYDGGTTVLKTEDIKQDYLTDPSGALYLQKYREKIYEHKSFYLNHDLFVHGNTSFVKKALPGMNDPAGPYSVYKYDFADILSKEYLWLLRSEGDIPENGFLEKLYAVDEQGRPTGIFNHKKWSTSEGPDGVVSGGEYNKLSQILDYTVTGQPVDVHYGNFGNNIACIGFDNDERVVSGYQMDGAYGQWVNNGGVLGYLHMGVSSLADAFSMVFYEGPKETIRMGTNAVNDWRRFKHEIGQAIPELLGEYNRGMTEGFDRAAAADLEYGMPGQSLRPLMEVSGQVSMMSGVYGAGRMGVSALGKIRSVATRSKFISGKIWVPSKTIKTPVTVIDSESGSLNIRKAVVDVPRRSVGGKVNRAEIVIPPDSNTEEAARKLLEEIGLDPQNPLQGTTYTKKMVDRIRGGGVNMKLDPEHGFPLAVDESARFGRFLIPPSRDPLRRVMIEVDGSLLNRKKADLYLIDPEKVKREELYDEGVFQWLIEPNREVNHRRFIPNKRD